MPERPGCNSRRRSRWASRALGATAILVSGTSAPLARQQVASSVRFEVPSVKRADPDVLQRRGFGCGFSPSGHFEAPERRPAICRIVRQLPTSIFSALQEQLGLKLEPIRTMGDFLVIDHVERPTAN